jgi:hypothetical protein
MIRARDKVERAFLMDAIYRWSGAALLALSGAGVLYMAARWAARIFFGG